MRALDRQAPAVGATDRGIVDPAGHEYPVVSGGALGIRVDPGNQDGPVMVVTGSEDTATPYSWTYPVFEGVQTNDQGGLYAVLKGAGPNDWEDYQTVVIMWWQFTLNDKAGAGKALKRILDKDPWDTQYAFTDNFDL